ncbi:MAG TPA: aspartate kinase [Burkholderiales bacterium]|nr:aspartate kinase [Burkholderiales bacterium]
MWVVKLGGSLADYPEDLRRWLKALAEAGKYRTVIVPGGSFFADWVRETQKKWGFDDVAAHAMGLRAMEQFGLMLCALQRGLVPALSETEIRKVLHENQVPVWLPVQILASEDLSPSWDVTSDSLAAWLAKRLKAEQLVLVKSCVLPSGKVEAAELAKNGIVDAAFPSLVQGAEFDTWLLGRKDYSRISSFLVEKQAGGAKVYCQPAGLRASGK